MDVHDWKWPKSGRWRYALVLAMGFFIAGGLILAAKWESDRQAQLRMDSFRMELADLSRISETIIANRFRQYDDILLVLREEFVADPKRFPQNVQFLRSGPLADRELMVVLVDHEGYLTYTDTPNVPARLYLGDRAYFRYFADGGEDRFYIDEPTFGRVTRRYSLPLVRPIYDKQGDFLGVVAISVKQESLAHFGHRLQLSKDTSVTVVNNGGAVVTSSHDLARVQGTKILPDLLAPMLMSNDGVFSSSITFDGAESAIAYRHITGFPLIIYLTSSPREVLQAISAQKNLLLLGSSFTSFVILALIVVNLQRRKITARFIATQRAHLKEAQRIAGMGSWELDLETLNFHWSDEVYRLFGVSREAFKPDLDNFLSLVPEAGRAAVRAGIEQAAVEGCWNAEHFSLRGDGQLREMVELGEAVRNAAGKVVALIGTVQDITERKRTEAALRESEEKYRSIFENAIEGFFQSTPDGRFISVNKAYAEIYGYKSPDEVISSISDIETQLYVNPEDRQRSQRLLQKDGAVKNFEFKAKRKDNIQIWVSHSIRAIYNKEGDIVLYEGSVNDITERKQNEEQYRQTIESSIDGFWVVDINGMFLNVNDAYCKMSGYSRTELLGMSITDIEELESRKETEQRIRNILKSGSERFETRHRRKNGGVIDVEISTTYTQENGGMFFVFIRNITERKLTEKLFIEGEQRFKALFDQAPLSYQSLDSDGNFIEVNKAWLETLGYKKEEVIGKNFGEFLHPDWQAHFKTNFPRFKAVGEILGVEFEIAKKDGTYILVSFHGKIGRESNGTFKQTHCVFMDVTERKRLEDERIVIEAKLQQAQKMESIGTLSGGIAHDFNNILFPIVGNTEMLLEDIPADSPLREYLNQIYDAALRARDLVRQILTFSRQDSHEIKLMKIQPIIREALKLIRSTIPTSIEIKQYIRSDCGIIKADPTQIHQVVMNLATNAYHAMEESDGQLNVTLKEIELGEQDVPDPDIAPGTYAWLTIADTGTGMDAELTGKIFEPFFTTKALGKGTGMGLSVVHGIVKNAGGSIHVHSEPDKGTEFHVYLPVVMGASKQQEIPKREPLQGGTEQILIVDDESAIVDMEKQMLERLGYSVVSHASSLDALEAFRTDPTRFDLVITDMAMPNMSGDTLASEMVKIRPDIPILLCTGFSEKLSEERAASLGIRGFLMKPIVSQDLSRKIRAVLDNTADARQK